MELELLDLTFNFGGLYYTYPGANESSTISRLKAGAILDGRELDPWRHQLLVAG